MTADKKLLRASAICLGMIWIIASAPLGLLLYEFVEIRPVCDSNLAWIYATYYGAFYLHPFFFSGFALAALVIPLATSVRLLERDRTRLVLIAAFYVLTTIAICLIEFVGSPYAPFEVAPDVLTQTPQGQAFLAKLRTVCDPTTFAFKNRYGEFQDAIKALIPLGQSKSAILYRVSFAVQAMAQNLVFAVFVTFLLFSKDRLKRAAPAYPNAVFILLGYAIFLYSLWCLFRISYRIDGNLLFGTNNFFAADYLIVILYGIVMTIFILYFEFDFEKLAKTLSQFSQLVVFVFGVALIQKGDVSYFFGIKASLLNVIAVVLLFIFLSAITLAFALKSAAPRRRR